MLDKSATMKLEGRTAVVVAHPDDETLWAGGLLARYENFDVICCSIPARDPERAIRFFEAVRTLGHYPILLPFAERDAQTLLGHLHHLDLSRYNNVVTHNEEGEYGHLHHQQLHAHICENFKGNIFTFGFGRGNIAIALTDHEKASKLLALKVYDNISISDNGVPKWKALLAKYNVDFEVEYFRTCKKQSEVVNDVMSEIDIRQRSDYQHFVFDNRQLSKVGDRLLNKLEALGSIIPELNAKTVLDIGCDFGFWSFYASQKGAKVVGLDRSRVVRDLGWVDIPRLNNDAALRNQVDALFVNYEAGRQWFDFKKSDLVLCMSLYHHIFNVCGDHEAIWYWLHRITGECLIWENPIDLSDSVVQKNVSNNIKAEYNEKTIRETAERYFAIDYTGPALHEVTRQVWRMVPKTSLRRVYTGLAQAGAGGATNAFLFENHRRIKELSEILGKEMFPGSLNVKLPDAFDWERRYFRSQILDVRDRAMGLNSDWVPRWCRFYPVKLARQGAWVMRFENEAYPLNFIELISDVRLRDFIHEGAAIEIEQD